jgi:HPr kinase/phosphorylase
VKPKFTVRQLVDRLGATLHLEQIGDPVGLDRAVTSPEAASPGLVLSGYFNRFPHERIQVFGETEVSYLDSRDPDGRRSTLETFFSHPIPCVFITKGQEPPTDFSSWRGEAAWRCCARRSRRPSSIG